MCHSTWVLLLIAAAQAVPFRAPDGTDQFLAKYQDSTLSRLRGNTSTCTEQNIRVRRSWTDLSLTERKEYIDAVKCLRTSPARTDLAEAPGARNRGDDFTVIHVKQTPYVHWSGWLLPWHRYFVWQYETALREECGYTGTQPYWNWPEHNNDYTQSPLFDGSEYSLGGSGGYSPIGTAGCVKDGAFANDTLNLASIWPGTYNGPESLGYSPHCMARNFISTLGPMFLSSQNVSTLLSMETMGKFRQTVDDGVHFAGHTVLGGDVSDSFTAPQDPSFYFHHGQLDRIWAIWQEQNPDVRLFATSDTQTSYNNPPSPNATLSDVLEFGIIGGDVVLGDVMDTVNGLLCYRYA